MCVGGGGSFFSRSGFHFMILFYRERGMLESLPHKNVEELNSDVVLKEPCSLERLLLSFSYFMPIIT